MPCLQCRQPALFPFGLLPCPPFTMHFSMIRTGSAQVRFRVRQIDCVTVKGSNQPMEIYSYDIDLEAAAPGPKPIMSILKGGKGAAMDVDEEDSKSFLPYDNPWAENPDLTDTWALDDAFKSKYELGFQVGTPCTVDN